MTELRWRKSTYSGSAQGECVEVGLAPALPVGVRDTKQGHLEVQPTLFVPGSAWRALLAAVRPE